MPLILLTINLKNLKYSIISYKIMIIIMPPIKNIDQSVEWYYSFYLSNSLIFINYF